MARYFSSKPHGIMFHHFHGNGHPIGQGSISTEQFESIVRFVGLDRILTPQEWMEKAFDHTLDNDDICITFDDNLRCQYDIAGDVLDRLGLKAFWFVYTSVLDEGLDQLEIYRYFRTTSFTTVDDFYSAFFEMLGSTPWSTEVDNAMAEFTPKEYLVDFPFYTDSDRLFRYVRDQVLKPERYGRTMDTIMEKYGFEPKSVAGKLWMDAECLKGLAESGHVVGLHSDTHPTCLSALPGAQQEREYKANFSRVNQVTGTPPVAMSHPCNSYASETLQVLQDLGIKLGFRANMASSPNRSHMEYPREDHINILRMMEQGA
jgi:peptidoglycan/xylan/chitin deacetylase (PgdA/CDA1 family)